MIPSKNQRVSFFARLGTFTHVLTESLNKREKRSTSRHPALERRTKRVTPGFRPVRSLLDAVGPSLLSATDLTSRCGIDGEICRPLNHK